MNTEPYCWDTSRTQPFGWPIPLNYCGNLRNLCKKEVGWGKFMATGNIRLSLPSQIPTSWLLPPFFGGLKHKYKSFSLHFLFFWMFIFCIVYLQKHPQTSPCIIETKCTWKGTNIWLYNSNTNVRSCKGHSQASDKNSILQWIKMQFLQWIKIQFLQWIKLIWK